MTIHFNLLSYCFNDSLQLYFWVYLSSSAQTSDEFNRIGQEVCRWGQNIFIIIKKWLMTFENTIHGQCQTNTNSIKTKCNTKWYVFIIILIWIPICKSNYRWSVQCKMFDEWIFIIINKSRTQFPWNFGKQIIVYLYSNAHSVWKKTHPMHDSAESLVPKIQFLSSI